MERLKRNEEGVSPVIATILMVAITVVLAATLYMMVGDIGGDTTSSTAGRITDRELENGDTDNDPVAQFEFVSLEQPSSVDPGDLEITVLDDGGDELFSGSGDTLTNDWTLLNDDGEVVGGSRFDLGGDLGDDDPENIEEVIIRIDGYSGQIAWEA
ncbi:MAG: archaellin/type IV pilin N-terminal domain-containing protein [Candidatus Aenigmatarchaeota archaeon]